MRTLALALLTAWLFGLALLGWIGFGDWTANDDESLGALLIGIALCLPLYAFTIGALTKALVLRREGRPELPVWAASAVVLYAIPGVALGQIFKGA